MQILTSEKKLLCEIVPVKDIIKRYPSDIVHRYIKGRVTFYAPAFDFFIDSLIKTKLDSWHSSISGGLIVDRDFYLSAFFKYDEEFVDLLLVEHFIGEGYYETVKKRNDDARESDKKTVNNIRYRLNLPKVEIDAPLDETEIRVLERFLPEIFMKNYNVIV